MKKLHFSLVATLFALCAMVSFTACSSSSDDDNKSSSSDIKTSIVGTWELTHIKGWYWADDNTPIIVDKNAEGDEVYRLILNADGTCAWHNYYKGGWVPNDYDSYELGTNTLTLKYKDKDRDKICTYGPFKIISIKGNTMICTINYKDEEATELTFTRK